MTTFSTLEVREYIRQEVREFGIKATSIKTRISTFAVAYAVNGKFNLTPYVASAFGFTNAGQDKWIETSTKGRTYYAARR